MARTPSRAVRCRPRRECAVQLRHTSSRPLLDCRPTRDLGDDVKGLPELFSDRRVPANEIVRLAPGELFVHYGSGGMQAARA